MSQENADELPNSNSFAPPLEVEAEIRVYRKPKSTKPNPTEINDYDYFATVNRNQYYQIFLDPAGSAIVTAIPKEVEEIFRVRVSRDHFNEYGFLEEAIRDNETLNYIAKDKKNAFIHKISRHICASWNNPHSKKKSKHVEDDEESEQEDDHAQPKSYYLYRGGIVMTGDGEIVGQYTFNTETKFWGLIKKRTLEYGETKFDEEKYGKYLQHLNPIRISDIPAGRIAPKDFATLCPTIKDQKESQQYGIPFHNLRGYYVMYENGGVAFQLNGLSTASRFWIGTWDAKRMGKYCHFDIDYSVVPEGKPSDSNETFIPKQEPTTFDKEALSFDADNEGVFKLIQKRNAHHPLAGITGTHVTPAFSETTLMAVKASVLEVRRKGLALEYDQKRDAFQVPSYGRYDENAKVNLVDIAHHQFETNPVVIYHRDPLQLKRLVNEYKHQSGLTDREIRATTKYTEFLKHSAQSEVLQQGLRRR